MRIQFKQVRYKNILSTGNLFTKIDLDRKPTTLISGSNGSGKSTLLDALTFGLYGKPFRKINKGQLLNSINKKDLLVEIDFSVGGSSYTIRRGIKPNLFEIIKDGQLVDQSAAVKDYQSYLEEFILGINYKSFNQIVVLGSATYVPFMELPASTRRDIIEDLLDIQVFSTMNLLAKDRISDNRQSLTDNDYNTEMVKQRIESAQEHNDSIRKIRETEVEKIRERMQVHLDKIEGCKTEIDGIQESIENLYTTISDKKNVTNKYATASDIRKDMNTNLRNFLKDLKFYHDNDSCPTCKQGIEHDFKDSVIKEKEDKKIQIEAGMVEIDGKISGYETRIAEISEVEEDIQNQTLGISELRGEIKIAKNALLSYKNELDAAEQLVEEVDTSKLESFQNELSVYTEERKELLDHQSVLGVLSTILKDGGIKARIISQYIPVMNKLINKYLGAFDLFVDFQLDENFNEVIKSRFRDAFSYASFSEGEKLRITLSIMLAWRSVAKLRNSVSTNLLLLDETLDGALDGSGIENLIETLHNLNTDDNIFVISHRGDQFAEKFTSHIKFDKVKNFSEIA
jgi:DNA repair exonuclease SbcCD ATPase subunit